VWTLACSLEGLAGDSEVVAVPTCSICSEEMREFSYDFGEWIIDVV
jgi:hypothetical protein